MRFTRAVTLASQNDIVASRTELAEIPAQELAEFFIEHGQQSGRFRAKAYRSTRQTAQPAALDPQRIVTAKLAREVWERDGYLCRYCGIPVIPAPVLTVYASVVGHDAFPSGSTNASRHGVILAFRANVDHVLPHRRGGRTNVANLVTACWSCNYGKSNYLLTELGIDDPRDRAPEPSPRWHGLMEYLRVLRAVPSPHTIVM